MTYLAIHGELFEGVVSTTKQDDLTAAEVVTQGFDGEIETLVRLNVDGKIVNVRVRDSRETDKVGAMLTAENSDFLKALQEHQENLDELDVVSGAPVTSNSLIEAVKFTLKKSISSRS